MRFASFTAGIINMICLIVLILFFGIQIPTFGMWFYNWQFSRNNTHEVVQTEPEQLYAVTRHMLRYMQGNESELQTMAIVDGELRPFFSDIEIRHMEDVYELFRIGFLIRDVALIFWIISGLFFMLFSRKRVYILFKSWQYGAATVFALFVALVIAIAINWSRAFVIFHEIFFDNDYWILDGRVDLLVNIVPAPFFISISVFIGAFFALGLITMFICGKLLARRGRPFTLSGRY